MNKKQIQYIFLTLVFFAILLLGFLSVSKLSENGIANYKTLIEINKTVDEQNENEINLESNTFKLKTIEEENKKQNAKLTDYNKSQESISKINKIMKQVGVIPKKLKLIDKVKVDISDLENENEVYILKISFLGEGNYSSILDFINKLENDFTHYEIDNLSIYPADIKNSISISANISLFVVKGLEDGEKKLLLPTLEEPEDPFYYGGE